MQIIGHRGAAGIAPENTVKGFEAALQAGVDMIEFDVRATKDGKVVVIHDPNTLRTGFKWNSIKKTPYSKLINVGKADQKIPTLQEALDVIYPKAKADIEIKSSGCEEAVVENIERLVKKDAAYEDFLVTSFNLKILEKVHKLNPKIKLGLIHGAFSYSFLKAKVPLSTVVFNYLTITKRVMAKAKDKNLIVFAWTIDSPSRAQSLKKIGVDGIITNRPDKIKA
ncbi:MAG TPA: glycerophosphodiester phosphodiesterase [Candidatus Saccharimonadales bacterium]|nr:glycerophosphodiester phosphodiesterase [Candidatus Saccharimonadales bacterium]